MFPRCGSVVTCTMSDGFSYYGRVERFLKIDGNKTGFASVKWFSKPVYPHGTPLVVRVEDDGSDVEDEFGSVIRLTQIEPSRVIVEHPEQPGGEFHVMRDSGYDKLGR